MAVGSTVPDAAVSTSADGVTWNRVSHNEATFGQARMAGVTQRGPGLVAVGRTGPRDSLDAAVWTSIDGITWSRIPNDEPIFGGSGRQEMAAIAAGGPGLVAVGSDGSGDDVDAAVWTSADGIT